MLTIIYRRQEAYNVCTSRAVDVSFFFQAEDGIRDGTVTGVQTCALPICFGNARRPGDRITLIALAGNDGWEHLIDGTKLGEREMLAELVRIIRERDPDVIEGRSEERRVGKECRCRGSA